MKRIDKNGKKRKLNITYIYKDDGPSIEDIMKEICTCYLNEIKLR